MMHPHSATHRKERGVFPVSQQRPRPLDPACRLRSRACYRNKPRQIVFSDRQLNPSSPCRHDLPLSSRESKEQSTAPQSPNESLTKDRFHGIGELVGVGAIYKGRRRFYPDKIIRVRLESRLLPQASFVELAVNTWVGRNHIAASIKTTAGQQGIS